MTEITGKLGQVKIPPVADVTRIERIESFDDDEWVFFASSLLAVVIAAVGRTTIRGGQDSGLDPSTQPDWHGHPFKKNHQILFRTYHFIGEIRKEYCRR